jgi:restriction system protein
MGALVSMVHRPKRYKVQSDDSPSGYPWKEPTFNGAEYSEDIYELWDSRDSHALTARPDKWTLDLLRSIDWKRFEELCAEYFRICGFRATTQSHGPDGGIDIKLYAPNQPDKVVNVVQCKQWSRMVGPKAIRELLGVMTANALSRGVFVTSSSFNDEATQFARENGIHLIDGVALLRKILDRSPEEQATLLGVATDGEYLVPTCPRCGIKLVNRENRMDRSAFWGCKNYPSCRYTLRA